MNDSQKTQFVARCGGIGAQHATNTQNHATTERNDNATNSLKALADVVLERNKSRNDTATDSQKPRNKLAEKNDGKLRESCADLKPESEFENIEIQPGDRRKFCRMCQYSRAVYGRGKQVICCTVKDQTHHDDWPRHCADYQSNGQAVPTVGIRWTPETQN